MVGVGKKDDFNDSKKTKNTILWNIEISQKGMINIEDRNGNN